MTTKNTEERKALEKRIEALWTEHEAKAQEINGIERQMDEIYRQARALEDRLEALKPKAIRISDHAIVRYLERQAGIDIDAIRKSILESQLPTMVGALGGSGSFPVNGYHVVLKDYTVVTIK